MVKLIFLTLLVPSFFLIVMLVFSGVSIYEFTTGQESIHVLIQTILLTLASLLLEAVLVVRVVKLTRRREAAVAPAEHGAEFGEK